MRVNVACLELFMPGSRSLKDKRHSVKGLKDRLRARLNVSVAEVEHQETWQRCTLAVGWVSGDGSGDDAVFATIEKIVNTHREVTILRCERVVY